MANVIASNYLLLQDALQLSGLLDSLGKVRLFINNLDPSNETPYASFAQPTYPGYAPLPMAGKSQGVRAVANGIVFVPFGSFSYVNSSGPSVTVRGWFIADFGLNWYAATKWITPRVLPAGGQITFDLSLEVRGLNVAAP